MQEKVLATAMKLVERRFADGELNKKIEEKVLATAMKLVQRREGTGAAAEAVGDLAKKLEMDFESRVRMVDGQACTCTIGCFNKRWWCTSVGGEAATCKVGTLQL